MKKLHWSGIWQSFLKVSLWLASIGLMVASSGLDGAYLAKLMPAKWVVLGLVLNTVADVTSELGMYWYGRLQMDKSVVKRKRAKWILVGQVVLVGFAWLFGWRQLVPIIAQVDPTAPWMAPIGAAFIPAALIVVGYTQSLLAGRIEVEKVVGQMTPAIESVEAIEATVDAPLGSTASIATMARMLGFTVTEEMEQRINEFDPAVQVDASLDRSEWRTARIDDFRLVLGRLNGSRSTLNVEQLESELAVDKKKLPSDSTVKRWLAVARSGEKVN